jgi:hypothetical protein
MKRIILPISIRVPHHANDSVTVHDVLDTGEDLLDIFPNDDILSFYLVAYDVLDIRLSEQAEGLSGDHGLLQMADTMDCQKLVREKVGSGGAVRVCVYL